MAPVVVSTYVTVIYFFGIYFFRKKFFLKFFWFGFFRARQASHNMAGRSWTNKKATLYDSVAFCSATLSGVLAKIGSWSLPIVGALVHDAISM